MDYNTPEIYKFYKDQGGILSKEIFYTLCQEFNQRVMEEIILEGYRFNLGENLSTISIGRIKRNYKNKQIDWAASKKLKQELLDEGKKLYDDKTGEGHEWLIYYTNEWYCRFYWNKGKCTVPNKTAYKFVATRGKKGNKTKLKNLLNEDDLAYLKFEKL